MTDYKFSENISVNKFLTKVMQDVKSFTELQSEHIKKLNNIGISLSAETNREKLLEMILMQAVQFTNSDGGTLYMMTDDQKFLEFNVVFNDSLGVHMGGTKDKITWPHLPLYKEDGNENREMVAVLSALENKMINIEDVYEAEGFNFDGTKKFDESTGYRSKSMLVIPMDNHEGDVVGVLQLINRQDNDSKEVMAFGKDDEESTMSLAAQAGMSITNLKLIQGLQDLLESFIKSIAGAIDAKSPYTGGHVRKVAEITMMIAGAVNKANKGKYKEVKYSEDQLNELRIAALMHDVGKITTPEYVVDKANKLETIYDRIGVVQTRFEIIKRDLEIELLKEETRLTKAGQTDKLFKKQEEYLSKIKELEDDLFFLEESNKGGEFMADDKIERIHKIAGKIWKKGGERKPLLTEDEVYNLSIRKGTLTEEERQKINDHATMTLKMLDALPFPKKLKRVPEIAGGHHEKLNGKGYPLGLTAEQLTLEARILALADIFEALTASDRPYKGAKKLSEAQKIINFMIKDGELDEDLVNFFYESGLHKEYGEKELKKEQLDI